MDDRLQPAARRALALLLAAGCGGHQAPAASTEAETAEVTGILPLTGGAADPTDPQTPIKLDLPDFVTGGATGGKPLGCDKVDFLFVIDNSGSMLDEQASLIASFPGFIAAIEQTVQAKDYHIMAVSTDDGRGVTEGDCDFEECVCAPSPTCCVKTCDHIFAETCNGIDCDALPVAPCDLSYGSGRVVDQLGAACGLAGGRRYMLESQAALTDAFECAASVGVGGAGDEKPMLAAIEAVSPEMNAPGGCNGGFLREDAILVLVVITDEEDDPEGGASGSPGAPKDWYDAVVAAKGGVPESVVVLGLVGDGNLPGSPCPPVWDPNLDGAEPSPRLQSFVGMFPHGVLGSVCVDDYAPFFLDAVRVIDVACDDFGPIG